jgi:hypothetical protein
MAFAALFAACSSFDASEDTTSTPDGGAADQASSDDATSDGGNGDGAPRGCDLSHEFGAPIDVPGFAGIDVSDFSLDDNELEVTFTRRRDGDAGGPLSVHHAWRASTAAPFGPPEPHTALNTAPDDSQSNRAGSISPSGLTLIYYSSISVDFRLWTSTRVAASPTSPFPPGTQAPVPNVATSLVHPGWVSPTEVIATGYVDRRVYRLTWNGAGFSGGQPIAELDPYRPMRAFASADQEVIVFTSDADGGGYVMQEARRNGQVTFGKPRTITELAADSSDLVVHWISRDGCRIYFGTSGAGTRVPKVAARK